MAGKYKRRMSKNREDVIEMKDMRMMHRIEGYSDRENKSERLDNSEVTEI